VVGGRKGRYRARSFDLEGRKEKIGKRRNMWAAAEVTGLAMTAYCVGVGVVED
jgi:hypothetical protein